MTLAWRYAARTDVGLVRSRNEDSGYAGPHLLVLADGMGGHAAGNVASSIAVGEMVHLDSEALRPDEAMALSGTALHSANLALRNAVRSDPALTGMGTTVTALLRTGDKVVLIHIGDSRAYLARGGTFDQISKDHSYVQALVDEGRISADEAMHHPQRSLITRVLTGQVEDDPDLSLREALPGDRYLLCSDGLSDYVAQDEIAEIVLHDGDTARTAERLVEVALGAGAPDNVTCIVADLVDVTTASDTDRSAPAEPQIVGAAAERRSATTQSMPQAPSTRGATLLRSPGGRTPDADGSDVAGPRGGGSVSGAASTGATKASATQSSTSQSGTSQSGAISSGAAGAPTADVSGTLLTLPEDGDAAGTHGAPDVGHRSDGATAVNGRTAGGDLTLAEEGSTGGLRWIRVAGLVALVLVVLGGGGYAAYAWSQQQWFVGQAHGHVAIYRGVPQSIGSWRLAHVDVETDISTADLPPFYRSKVAAHIDATGEQDARKTVLDLSGQALRCQRIQSTGGTCGTGS